MPYIVPGDFYDIQESVKRFQNIAEKISSYNTQSIDPPLEYTMEIVTQTVKMEDTKWLNKLKTKLK